MINRYRMDVQQLYLIAKKGKKAAKKLNEICGILVRNNNDLDLIPVKNESSDILNFSMSHRWRIIAIRYHSKPFRDIVGSYHSHPFSKAEPSKGDISGSWNNHLMLIYDCTHNEYRLWRIINKKAKPLPFLRQRRGEKI